jgi:hypothetical protein
MSRRARNWFAVIAAIEVAWVVYVFLPAAYALRLRAAQGATLRDRLPYAGTLMLLSVMVVGLVACTVWLLSHSGRDDS